MSDKKLSCGVFIVDSKDRVLMMHTTDQVFWDIPKGTQEPGETTLETAIRELKEETGVSADPNDFYPLGLFGYNNFKDVYLYAMKVDDIDIDSLVCSSFYTNDQNIVRPECDQFKMIPLHECSDFMCNSMRKVFDQEVYGLICLTLYNLNNCVTLRGAA